MSEYTITKIKNGYTVNKHSYLSYAEFFPTIKEVTDYLLVQEHVPTGPSNIQSVTAAEAASDMERVYQLANEGKI